MHVVSNKNSVECVKDKGGEKRRHVNIQERNCFKISEESVIKCALGFNMCGERSKMMDGNSKNNLCPVCEDTDS